MLWFVSCFLFALFYFEVQCPVFLRSPSCDNLMCLLCVWLLPPVSGYSLVYLTSVFSHCPLWFFRVCPEFKCVFTAACSCIHALCASWVEFSMGWAASTSPTRYCTLVRARFGPEKPFCCLLWNHYTVTEQGHAGRLLWEWPPSILFCISDLVNHVITVILGG